MAVVQVSQFRVNPGKAEAFNALLKEAEGIVQHYGGRTRTLQTLYGGPNAQVVSLLMETDDLASNANLLEQVLADPSYLAFAAKFNGADSPAILLSRSLLRDLPQ